MLSLKKVICKISRTINKILKIVGLIITGFVWSILAIVFLLLTPILIGLMKVVEFIEGNNIEKT